MSAGARDRLSPELRATLLELGQYVPRIEFVVALRKLRAGSPLLQIPRKPERDHSEYRQPPVLTSPVLQLRSAPDVRIRAPSPFCPSPEVLRMLPAAVVRQQQLRQQQQDGHRTTHGLAVDPAHRHQQVHARAPPAAAPSASPPPPSPPPAAASHAQPTPFRFSGLPSKSIPGLLPHSLPDSLMGLRLLEAHMRGIRRRPQGARAKRLRTPPPSRGSSVGATAGAAGTAPLPGFAHRSGSVSGTRSADAEQGPLPAGDAADVRSPPVSATPRRTAPPGRTVGPFQSGSRSTSPATGGGTDGSSLAASRRGSRAEWSLTSGSLKYDDWLSEVRRADSRETLASRAGSADSPGPTPAAGASRTGTPAPPAAADAEAVGAGGMGTPLPTPALLPADARQAAEVVHQAVQRVFSKTVRVVLPGVHTPTPSDASPPPPSPSSSHGSAPSSAPPPRPGAEHEADRWHARTADQRAPSPAARFLEDQRHAARRGSIASAPRVLQGAGAAEDGSDAPRFPWQGFPRRKPRIAFATADAVQTLARDVEPTGAGVADRTSSPVRPKPSPLEKRSLSPATGQRVAAAAAARTSPPPASESTAQAPAARADGDDAEAERIEDHGRTVSAEAVRAVLTRLHAPALAGWSEQATDLRPERSRYLQIAERTVLRERDRQQRPERRQQPVRAGSEKSQAAEPWNVPSYSRHAFAFPQPVGRTSSAPSSVSSAFPRPASSPARRRPVSRVMHVDDDVLDHVRTMPTLRLYGSADVIGSQSHKVRAATAAARPRAQPAGGRAAGAGDGAAELRPGGKRHSSSGSSSTMGKLRSADDPTRALTVLPGDRGNVIGALIQAGLVTPAADR